MKPLVITSKSIAEAIVEQQVLKKKVYNRTALKKTYISIFYGMLEHIFWDTR